MPTKKKTKKEQAIWDEAFRKGFIAGAERAKQMIIRVKVDTGELDREINMLKEAK